MISHGMPTLRRPNIRSNHTTSRRREPNHGSRSRPTQTRRGLGGTESKVPELQVAKLHGGANSQGLQAKQVELATPTQVAQLSVSKAVSALFGSHFDGLPTVGATQRNRQPLSSIISCGLCGERQGKRIRRADYGQPLPGIDRLSLWLGWCFGLRRSFGLRLCLGFGGCFFLRGRHDILHML